INPQVDPVTRNVDVQATIPNPAERLRPGMFSRAFIELAQSERIVAVPASAVSYAPYGDSVYIVEHATDQSGQQTTTVRQQIVKLGARKGEMIAVTGVQPGEEVVTSGVFKLRPGAPIFINNDVQPGASIEPKPADT
ncbi:MAG: efflux transporter periplasmic adaptor subunit, partial [Proteobacteria bacterium]|nr:efflux transporter periplasmic adaptor subunit [Pseudomonadota bacterium]